MDPTQAWNAMLVAYATKQWHETSDFAEGLLEWLEGGGFTPQPTIGTTTGNFTCQLDSEFSRAICIAACQHAIERSIQEVSNDA